MHFRPLTRTAVPGLFSMFCALVASGAMSVVAQSMDQPQKPAGVAAAGGMSAPLRGVLASEYKIRPGDTLDIRVLGVDSLSGLYTIQPDGMIAFSVIGRFRAVGMTVLALEQELVKRSRDFLKNPVITVSIQSYRLPSVWIMGQVKNPGPVQIQPGFTVRDYIDAAGGLTDAADLSRMSVTRFDGTVTSVDMSGRVELKNLPEISEDDIVTIPELKGNISVLGKVAKAGTYTFRRGMKLSDAVAEAGGILDDGDAGRTELITGEKRSVYDLQAFLSRADTEQNPELFPGDVVFIPEGKRKVYVYGAVTKPGIYKVDEGQTMMDVVLKAGIAQDAQMSKSVLVKMEGGQPFPKEVNLDKFQKTGLPNLNPVLDGGEIVYVAERGQNRDFLTNLTQFTSLLIGLTAVLK